MVQEGPAPTEDQLSRLAGISRSGPRQSEAPSEELLGPWADRVYRRLNVERLQLTRIQELLATRGCQVGLLVPAPVRRSPQLAGPEPQHGPDGGHRAGRGGGAGLRPSGSDPRPGDGPPPHGVGPDRGAGLLQAQLRLAHLQPETGRRHRGAWRQRGPSSAASPSTWS